MDTAATGTAVSPPAPAVRPEDSTVLVDIARYDDSSDTCSSNNPQTNQTATTAPILLHARRERLEVLDHNTNSENVDDNDEITATTATTSKSSSSSSSSSAPVSSRSSSTVTSSSSTTTTGTGTTAALLQDDHGNPLFPRLFRLRREGQKVSRQLAASVTTTVSNNQDSIDAWKQAGRQAAQAAHTNLKTIATQASSSLSSSLDNTNDGQQETSETNNDAARVRTPFGTGRLVVERQEYPDDEKKQQSSYSDDTANNGDATLKTATTTYVVQLPFGTLYTKQEPIQVASDTKKQHQRRRRKKPAPATALELNETFVQWEKARQRELRDECQRLGIPHDDADDDDECNNRKCFACLKEKHQQQQQKNSAQQKKPAPSNTTTTTNKALMTTADGKPLFPRLYQWRQSGQELVAKGSQAVAASAASAVNGGGLAADAQPCLLCGTPACARHCNTGFRREGVSVCLECLRHLDEYDAAHGTATTTTTTSAAATALPLEWTTQQQQQHHHLCDLYGRALLLLQYCAQFLPDTATQLERAAKQHNEIAGVGGSSAGLASGIMGVAAACTILTPAGPPLLVGSLLLGGSATAVQAGGSAMRYYSEPNQLANRVLTLQGIVDRILDIVASMRDTTLVPYLEDAISKLERAEGNHKHETATGAGPNHTTDDPKRAAVRAGTRMGGTAATSAAAGLVATTATQEGALAGRFASRATTAAARTARFARFAGGALSAATVLLEARQLSQTLEQIQRGSPCEKAQAVRRVHANLGKLPSQAKVEAVCQSYAKVRTKALFEQSMTGSAVLLSEEYQAVDDLVLVEQVVSSLEDGSGSSQQDDNCSITSDLSSNDGGGYASSTPPPPPPPPSSSVGSASNNNGSAININNNKPPSLSSKSSLLRRVQRYKERTAALAAAAPPSVDVAASLCV